MEVNSDYNEIIEIMASDNEILKQENEILKQENIKLKQENIKLKMTADSDHNSDIEENAYYKKFITKSADEIRDKIKDNQYVSSDDEDSDEYFCYKKDKYSDKFCCNEDDLDSNGKLSKRMREYITDDVSPNIIYDFLNKSKDKLKESGQWGELSILENSLYYKILEFLAGSQSGSCMFKNRLNQDNKENLKVSINTQKKLKTKLTESNMLLQKFACMALAYSKKISNDNYLTGITSLYYLPAKVQELYTMLDNIKYFIKKSSSWSIMDHWFVNKESLNTVLTRFFGDITKYTNSILDEFTNQKEIWRKEQILKVTLRKWNEVDSQVKTLKRNYY